MKLLEPWTQKIRAGKQPALRILIAGILAIVGIAVIVFLMLNSRESSAEQEQSQHNREEMAKLSQVFEENEKRIGELQKVAQNLMNKSPEISTQGEQKESDAKALAIRQKTQTDVYRQTGTIPEERESSMKMLHPERTIPQGEWIHVVLETAINGELPGMVRAVVTEPVYSFVGEHILIPSGSRLIGQYVSKNQNGIASSRLFVIWNRVITPSGVSLWLESPGTDDLGRSGLLADHIDTHFFARFGEAILLSVIGGGISTVGVSSQDEANSRDAFRTSLAESFKSSASESLSRGSISPTLSLNQGDSMEVLVAKDWVMGNEIENYTT
jgi:type IV secretory pathway VirB10-like protein